MMRYESPGAGSAAHLARRIYDDLVADMCVIFVGAGSTTERPNPLQPTPRAGFYETIRAKSEYPDSATRLGFAELMGHFCTKLDGGRKNRLIREAISYIETFCVPGEDNGSATSVCDEISQIPFFKHFVTTNWDPFLERSLDVLVPTVDDRDLAFWDDKKRQVLKIHGCISRPFSLVATESDYTRCLSSNPLIFNKLRDLMATKTFVFIGYSMRDSDFREVWTNITDRLGPFAKLAYAVNPNADATEIEYWQERGIEVFCTSDTLFLRAIHDELEKEER